MNTRTARLAASTFFAAAAMVPTADAELVVGLTTTGQLVRFDSANPATLLGSSPAISGLNSGDSIVDIDFYPVNNALYGIGTSGVLYTINPVTGAATVDAVPQASLGGPLDADFNPAADRLRVFSANDANFRITPSVNTAGSTGASSGLVTADGTLTYGAGGPNPNLVANAYNNNFDGTAATTLYSIDTELNALIIHSGAPQFSTLAQVGPLGVNVGSNVGFDISPLGSNFLSDGNNFYTINLATGALTPAGIIGGSSSAFSVTTIAAAVPAPTSAAAFGLAMLAGLRRRRGN